jgi:hypothetical protein
MPDEIPVGTWVSFVGRVGIVTDVRVELVKVAASEDPISAWVDSVEVRWDNHASTWVYEPSALTIIHFPDLSDPEAVERWLATDEPEVP